MTSEDGRIRAHGTSHRSRIRFDNFRGPFPPPQRPGLPKLEQTRLRRESVSTCENPTVKLLPHLNVRKATAAVVRTAGGQSAPASRDHGPDRAVTDNAGGVRMVYGSLCCVAPVVFPHETPRSPLPYVPVARNTTLRNHSPPAGAPRATKTGAPRTLTIARSNATSTLFGSSTRTPPPQYTRAAVEPRIIILTSTSEVRSSRRERASSPSCHAADRSLATAIRRPDDARRGSGSREAS